MSKRTWLGLGTSVAVAAVLAGCGGGSTAYGGGGYQAKSAPAETAGSPGYGYGSAEAAPASPAPSEGQAFDAAPEQERPGLGTEWGENRDSRVSTAPFFREDPDRPLVTAKLFYNDRDGIRAMARRNGFSSLGEGSHQAAGGALTVRLLDGSGHPLEGFTHGGTTFVVGEHGQRYIIQIQNHTRHRLEAVATVDGLDVINGQVGSFSNRGYIVSPFSTVEIDGFRRSMDTVAAFRFGTVRGSYAARKGDDRNVGVIGVAFFHERGSRFPWTNEEVDRRRDANPFPGQFADPPDDF